jgi:hypothetical protein
MAEILLLSLAKYLNTREGATPMNALAPARKRPFGPKSSRPHIVCIGAQLPTQSPASGDEDYRARFFEHIKKQIPDFVGVDVGKNRSWNPHQSLVRVLTPLGKQQQLGTRRLLIPPNFPKSVAALPALVVDEGNLPETAKDLAIYLASSPSFRARYHF